MKKIIKIILITVLLVAAIPAAAHQPAYIEDATRVAVAEPEISKAYYGVLPGQPVKFVISASTSFAFYANLLVPDRLPVAKNISALVMNQDGTAVARLFGPDFVWTKWHEEFAGDDYWRGPEVRQTLPAGTYTIIVSSSNNWERYVLAVGERESFPLSSLLKTEREIYLIKTEFFGKTGWAIFEGKIGRGLLIGVTVLLLVMLGILYWLIKRKAR